MKWLYSIALVGLCSLPILVYSQSAYEELQAILKAEVVEVVNERVVPIMGTDASTTVQTIEARIDEGDREGEIITFEIDYVTLASGDNIYLTHVRSIDGIETYIFKDVNRQGPTWLLLGLFILLLVVFAGKQGVRALLSLALSVGAIIFLLIPALLAGYEPVLASFMIASLILAIVLFGTHGLNAMATLAFVGTFSAVLCTSVIAWWFVKIMRLTGFGSDASVYLNFATRGELDFAGLLLGSIIIGILGVLDDVSITQVSVVQELKHASPGLGAKDLYQRAIRVGRDHVGSLVNTLALAYVGVALPLVLLFATSEASVWFSLNQEVVAAEIARIIIGSMGLILAVPLTTIVAAWWFAEHEVDDKLNSSHGHHHH